MTTLMCSWWLKQDFYWHRWLIPTTTVDTAATIPTITPVRSFSWRSYSRSYSLRSFVQFLLVRFIPSLLLLICVPSHDDFYYKSTLILILLLRSAWLWLTQMHPSIRSYSIIYVSLHSFFVITTYNNNNNNNMWCSDWEVIGTSIDVLCSSSSILLLLSINWGGPSPATITGSSTFLDPLITTAASPTTSPVATSAYGPTVYA